MKLYIFLISVFLLVTNVEAQKKLEIASEDKIYVLDEGDKFSCRLIDDEKEFHGKLTILSADSLLLTRKKGKGEYRIALKDIRHVYSPDVQSGAKRALASFTHTNYLLKNTFEMSEGWTLRVVESEGK